MQLPSEVLNKLINIGGMNTRELRCTKCNRVTEHIHISMSDTSDSYADRLVLGVMDYFPFMPVFIGNPCTFNLTSVIAG
jgi:hypothetical protein